MRYPAHTDALVGFLRLAFAIEAHYSIASASLHNFTSTGQPGGFIILLLLHINYWFG
jgi:hypothetical protein